VFIIFIRQGVPRFLGRSRERCAAQRVGIIRIVCRARLAQPAKVVFGEAKDGVDALGMDFDPFGDLIVRYAGGPQP